ncbi:hypothetical protein STEG23_034752 [Scotinomys teguina]
MFALLLSGFGRLLMAWLASSLPHCLALDSSSSSPCPAFLAIAKSVPFICRLTFTASQASPIRYIFIIYKIPNYDAFTTVEGVD